MSDLNWCTFCDNAVSPFSESLYCSEQCLRSDALRNHPLLGYTYPEFIDFPRPKPSFTSSNTTSTTNTTTNNTQKSPKIAYSNYSSTSTSPALTATSSQSDSPSLLSLPKFDLNHHANTNNSNSKSNGINYFSLFHHHSVTTSTN